MSYILSALRKAERDREQSNPVTTESFIAGDSPAGIGGDNHPAKGKRFVVAAVLATVILVLGLAALVMVERNTGVGEGKIDNRLSGSEPIGYRAPVIEEKPLEPPRAEIGKTGAEIAANNDSPAPANLPPLPPLNITGYIYFEENPARSKLFVDGIVYRKDSRLGPGLILTGFSRDSVTVSHRGTEKTIAVD